MRSRWVLCWAGFLVTQPLGLQPTLAQQAGTPKEFFQSRKRALEREEYAGIFSSFSKVSREKMLVLMGDLKKKCASDAAFAASAKKGLKLAKDVASTPLEELAVASLRLELGYLGLLELVTVEEKGETATLEVETSAFSRRRKLLHLVKEGGKWAEDYVAYIDDQNKITQCLCLINEVAEIVKTYQFDTGRFPPSGNANLVKALRTELPKRKIPYFDVAKEQKNSDGLIYYTPAMLSPQGELLDPWGKPLMYYCNADGSKPEQWKPHRRSSFDLYSVGPNRKDDQGQADDLNNWD